jgi:hypothetical protein
MNGGARVRDDHRAIARDVWDPIADGGAAHGGAPRGRTSTRSLRRFDGLGHMAPITHHTLIDAAIVEFVRTH